jgi:hypothetical protein
METSSSMLLETFSEIEEAEATPPSPQKKVI